MQPEARQGLHGVTISRCSSGVGVRLTSYLARLVDDWEGEGDALWWRLGGVLDAGHPGLGL